MQVMGLYPSETAKASGATHDKNREQLIETGFGYGRICRRWPELKKQTQAVASLAWVLNVSSSRSLNRSWHRRINDLLGDLLRLPRGVIDATNLSRDDRAFFQESKLLGKLLWFMRSRSPCQTGEVVDDQLLMLRRSDMCGVIAAVELTCGFDKGASVKPERTKRSSMKPVIQRVEHREHFFFRVFSRLFHGSGEPVPKHFVALLECRQNELVL